MTAEARLSLPPVTIETANEQAKPLLERAKAASGFVPNMYKGMANSPAMLATYMDGYACFRAECGFTPAEQEVVFLTISRGNGCEYCMGAHSMIAERKSKVPAQALQALRQGKPIADPKLAALQRFAACMFETRGLPLKSDLEAFLAAGYEERHALGIILAIAVKTISNYANHLFHTELDEVFSGYTWERAA